MDEQTPPSFIVGTRADTVTPPRHQLAFASALEKAGVDFELHIFPGGVHGMSLGKSLTCSGNASYVDQEYAQWFPMSVRWLKNKLGDFTIYGVNDGRNGRFHIDRPMAELFADEQASAIVSRYLPMASQLKRQPLYRRYDPSESVQISPGTYRRDVGGTGSGTVEAVNIIPMKNAIFRVFHEESPHLPLLSPAYLI